MADIPSEYSVTTYKVDIDSLFHINDHDIIDEIMISLDIGGYDGIEEKRVFVPLCKISSKKNSSHVKLILLLLNEYARKQGSARTYTLKSQEQPCPNTIEQSEIQKKDS